MRDKTYQRATSTKVQDGADKKKCNNIRKRRGIKKSHTMENSPLLDQRTDHDLQCETDRRCEVTGHDNTLMFYEDKERDRYYLNNKTDVFDGSNINQHDEDTRNRCKITGLINPTTTCDERNTTKYYLNNGAAISNAVNTNLNKSTTYDTPRRNCEITGHENKGISYDEAIKTFEMTERDKTSTYYDDQRNNKCYASDRENGYDGYNKCNKGSNKFTTGYNIQQTTVKRYSAPPTVCNIASTSFYNDKSNNKYCVDNKANESNVPITGTHQNTRPTYAQNTRPIGAPSCDESPTKCDVTGHDNSAKFYDGNQGNQYSFVDTLYQTISKDLLGRSTHGADDRPEPSIKRNCNMDVNVAAKDYRTSTISVRRATDARYDGRNIESEWNTQSSGILEIIYKYLHSFVYLYCPILIKSTH